MLLILILVITFLLLSVSHLRDLVLDLLLVHAVQAQLHFQLLQLSLLSLLHLLLRHLHFQSFFVGRVVNKGVSCPFLIDRFGDGAKQISKRRAVSLLFCFIFIGVDVQHVIRLTILLFFPHYVACHDDANYYE